MVSKSRNPGIAVKQPEKVCENDRNCPFHGDIPLRGKTLWGKVVRARIAKNALVEIDWLKKIPKYERYEKRRTRIMCHSPSCIGAKEGDMVRIMETRKISKTKSFVIIERVDQSAPAGEIA